MPAPATARCWRRARRSTSWRSATARTSPAATQAAGATARRSRSAASRVTFHPAGHVLGSAQIAVEHGGLRIVVSGDYKRRARPDLRAVRAGALRRLHHRGDLRPAGLPPSRRTAARSRRLLHSVAPVPRARPSRRRLCARQGAARDPPAARRRLRPADLHPRRAGRSSATTTRAEGIELGELRPATVEDGDKARLRRRDRRRPAVGLRRPLGAPLPRSGRLLRLGLDAHPPARQAARRRAAADHLRPCRLGRADRHHHARPAPREVWVTHGREEALVRWCELNGIAGPAAASRRLRGRGRLMQRLRRPARPPGADAVAQRQAEAASPTISATRRRSRPRAGAGRAHRRPRHRRRSSRPCCATLVAERIDPVLFALFLRLCRRPRRDRLADLAGHACTARRTATPTLAEVVDRLQAASRADGAAVLARLLDRPDVAGPLRPHQAGHRRLAHRRLGAARQAGAGRFRRRSTSPRSRSSGTGWQPPYADAVRLAGGQGAEARAGGAGALFRPVMLSHPVGDGDLDKLDPADYAAEWKWDGIRVQAVREGGVAPALFAHRRRHLRRLSRRRRGDGLRRRARRRTAGRRAPARRTGTFSDLQQRLNRKTVSAEDAGATIRPSSALRPAASSGEDLRAARLHASAARGWRPRRHGSTRRASTCRRWSPFADWRRARRHARARRRIRSSRA